MYPQKIGMLAGAAIGILATFLPWASVGAMSISGTAGDGWVTLALFIPALVIALVAGKKTGFIGTGALLGAGIPALLAAGLGAMKIVQVGDAGRGLASPGIGLYAVIAGGLLVIVLGFALKKAPAANA